MSGGLKQKIRQRMDELGIEPKRSLGQNFLISEGVVKRIIEAAEVKNYSEVFEIGPGLGALTDFIIEEAANLHLVELDQSFAEYWRGRSQTVIEIDALKHQWVPLKSSKRRLLISNLPYQISSRLVVDFSKNPAIFNRMILMFQKEVAQRIQAKTSSADYGLLSVVAQSYWSIEKVTEAGAIDFFPKPKVASRVLKFDHKPILDSNISDQEYLAFLKLSFANRRKILLPKLSSLASKDKLKAVFEDQSLDLKVRAENLSAEQFRDLYRALKTE